LIGLLNVSCSRETKKDNLIIKFEEFVNYVEKDAGNFTEEDWVKSDTTYVRFCRKFDTQLNEILKDTDKEKISRLKGKYQGLKFKYEANKTIDKIKDGFNDVKNQLDGFLEGVK